MAEQRDQARPRLSGRMHMVCWACGAEYGQKPCRADLDGSESTGICPACFPGELARMLREARELKEGEGSHA